jgi:Domain of unknown function (DUF1854)
MPNDHKIAHTAFVERDDAGRLIHVALDGTRSVGVVPVRAFPLSAPDAGISVVDARGHEVMWLDSLDQLPAPARAVLEDELRQREFRPTIERIAAVSTFATPSIWTVDTDRGATHFTLKAEEDIRRLDGPRLLITSEDGVCYEIRDRWALDRASRRLLERFL